MLNYPLDCAGYERLYRQVLQAESILNLLILDGQSIDGFESSHLVVMGALDNLIELIEKMRAELGKLKLVNNKHYN